MKFQLPLSEIKLKSFLQLEGSALDTFLKSLRHDEIAALILIPSLFANNSDLITDKKVFFFLNTQLSRLVPALLQSKEQMWEVPKSAFTINPTFNDIDSLLTGLKIELMSDSDIQRNEHLIGGIEWKQQTIFEPTNLISSISPGLVKSDYRAFDSQYRQLHNVLALHSESILLQGYAGVGKTTFSKILSEALISRHKAKIAYLSKTPVQIHDYESSIPKDKGFGLTYNQAIYICLNAKNLFGNRNNVKPNKDLSSAFSLSSIGSYQPSQVYSVVKKIIYNYCLTTDEFISSSHIPKNIKSRENEFVAAAQSVWNQLTTPSKSHPAPIEWHHRMKLLSQMDCGFNLLRCSHLIIDESQDIPDSLAFILNKTNKPFIALTDQMQNLTTIKKPPLRQTKYLEMTDSIRQSNDAVSIYSSLASNSLYDFQQSFAGSKHKSTSISLFREFELPQTPSIILVKTATTLVDLIGSFKKAGIKFAIVQSTRTYLYNFLQSCISLNNNKPHLAYHNLFYNCNNWSDFERKHQPPEQLITFLQSNKRIKNLISFTDTMKNFSVANELPTICLLDHCKSIEFKEAILHPDVFSFTKSGVQFEKNRIYLGCSRGSEKVHLPYNAPEFINELSSKLDTDIF